MILLICFFFKFTFHLDSSSNVAQLIYNYIVDIFPKFGGICSVADIHISVYIHVISSLVIFSSGFSTFATLGLLTSV